MAAIHQVTLNCDHPNCYANTDDDAQAYVWAARQRAAANGWVYRSGYDYCPDHAALHPARTRKGVRA